MTMKLPVLVVLSNFLFTTGLAQETVSSIPTQDEFFRAISELCGKAFPGTVTIDNDSSGSFANKKLIMHVRRCDETQLQIPFHVGEDASRTDRLGRGRPTHLQRTRLGRTGLGGRCGRDDDEEGESEQVPATGHAAIRSGSPA